MDEKTFLETINPRFWYIGDKKMWLWKCNALRAMVNGKEDKYASYVKEASCEASYSISRLINKLFKEIDHIMPDFTESHINDLCKNLLKDNKIIIFID